MLYRSSVRPFNTNTHPLPHRSSQDRSSLASQPPSFPASQAPTAQACPVSSPPLPETPPARPQPSWPTSLQTASSSDPQTALPRPSTPGARTPARKRVSHNGKGSLSRNSTTHLVHLVPHENLHHRARHVRLQLRVPPRERIERLSVRHVVHCKGPPLRATAYIDARSIART